MSSLMRGHDVWIEELIMNTFMEAEANIILQIHIPRSDSDDEIIWDYDKKGIFSIKSAYHVGMMDESKEETSSSNNENQGRWWKGLWKANVLPKVKICCWKLIHDIMM